MTTEKRPRLTPTRRAELVRGLKAGARTSALAEEFGVSASTVSQIKSRELGRSRSTTSAGKNVGMRLSPTELHALEKLKSRRGYTSNSDAMRSLLRLAVGLLEFEPEEAAQLEGVQSELHKIGVNINQIALAANRGRTDLLQHQWNEINDLRRALPEVRNHLKAVVEEQRRKGIRLYEKFREAENV